MKWRPALAAKRDTRRQRPAFQLKSAIVAVGGSSDGAADRSGDVVPGLVAAPHAHVSTASANSAGVVVRPMTRRVTPADCVAHRSDCGWVLVTGSVDVDPHRCYQADMSKVELETSMGNFTIELDTDAAPATVENFLAYVEAGHYTDTVFHRVIAGFMVQGGGYTTSFDKKPVREPVKNEADNGLKNVVGTVAMARTGDPHSATAQFFVNISDNGFLDHSGKNDRGWGYCVFGKVVDGMDVVDEVKGVETGSKGPFKKDAPQEDVVIKSAKLLD
jgi:peptidyl-prolyl cis-trans isomerase B (cyclophilin B)